MKKALAILMAVCALGLVVSGCNKSDETGAAPAATAGATGGAPAAGATATTGGAATAGAATTTAGGGSATAGTAGTTG